MNASLCSAKASLRWPDEEHVFAKVWYVSNMGHHGHVTRVLDKRAFDIDFFSKAYVSLKGIL
jgi:hypothetical protein